MFRIGDNLQYRGRVKMAVFRGAVKDHKDGFDPAVGITTPEVTARSEQKFLAPVRPPTEEERKKMTALALKTLILVVLLNHMFSFNNKIHRQSSGGAIGDMLTGALGAVLGLVHSRHLLAILADSGATVRFLQLYVDDGNCAMKALAPGSRFVEERNRIEIIDEEIENDMNVSADLRTANVVKDAANSVFNFVKVKIDCPSLHDDGWMPILDIKAKVDADKIFYMTFPNQVAPFFQLISPLNMKPMIARTESG